jgi:hypothetical protein
LGNPEVLGTMLGDLESLWQINLHVLRNTEVEVIASARYLDNIPSFETCQITALLCHVTASILRHFGEIVWLAWLAQEFWLAAENHYIV